MTPYLKALQDTINIGFALGTGDPQRLQRALEEPDDIRGDGMDCYSDAEHERAASRILHDIERMEVK